MALRQTDKTETFIHVTSERMLERLQNKTIYDLVATVTDKFVYNGFPVGEVFLCISFAVFLLYIFVCFMSKTSRLAMTGNVIISLLGIIYYWGIIFLVRGADHIQIAIIPWIILLFFIWTILLSDEDQEVISTGNWNDSESLERNIRIYSYCKKIGPI